MTCEPDKSIWCEWGWHKLEIVKTQLIKTMSGRHYTQTLIKCRREGCTAEQILSDEIKTKGIFRDFVPKEGPFKDAGF